MELTKFEVCGITPDRAEAEGRPPDSQDLYFTVPCERGDVPALEQSVVLDTDDGALIRVPQEAEGDLRVVNDWAEIPDHDAVCGDPDYRPWLDWFTDSFTGDEAVGLEGDDGDEPEGAAEIGGSVERAADDNPETIEGKGDSIDGPVGDVEEGPEVVERPRGRGCRRPTEVEGWETGKVLVAVKRHMGQYKDWGTCEYRVRCEPDGGYTLVFFQGNRTDMKAGTYWPNVSRMWFAILALDPAKKVHHRMTIKRFFGTAKSN
tara:strand:+ start:1240 stop:2022 length:783 start_codon:yes stop_codon:yes gene_type:complete